MSAHPSPQTRASSRAQGAAFVLLRVCLGVFMVAYGWQKWPWLVDARPVADQLVAWLADAPPIGRWYLERIIPGAPVFARLVPLSAMAGGAALAMGLWTRVAAVLCLLSVLSLQFASGAVFRLAYLADPAGLPLVGGLVALLIAGEGRKGRSRI